MTEYGSWNVATLPYRTLLFVSVSKRLQPVLKLKALYTKLWKIKIDHLRFSILRRQQSFAHTHNYISILYLITEFSDLRYAILESDDVTIMPLYAILRKLLLHITHVAYHTRIPEAKSKVSSGCLFYKLLRCCIKLAYCTVIGAGEKF